MSARRQSTPFSTVELVEALLDFDDIFELGTLIPDRENDCGRPRIYPGYMYVLYGALLSVFTKSRKVETELRSGHVWAQICAGVRARYPRDPGLWLPPARPMRRYHYSYVRNRYISDELMEEVLLRVFRVLACRHATELGLCSEEGGGSFTHPSLGRLVYADGKVIKPLYRAKPGTTVIDEDTGEIRTVRSDPDAKLHITGSGKEAWGNKFLIVGVRHPEPHTRVILDVRSVPRTTAEATVAVASFRELRPLLPGAHGVLYDGALAGIHNQVLLHELGWLPVVPVTAKSGGRRARKPREEREVQFETRVIRTPVGEETAQFFLRMGRACLVELDDGGNAHLRPLVREKVMPRQNKDGSFRWYMTYRLPADKGGGRVSFRLDRHPEDRTRRLNRTHWMRAIPTDDEDYERLYPRRSDVESINRALDDTLWLRRAHSKGRVRQLFELMGFALMTNAVAVYHRRRELLSRLAS